MTIRILLADDQALLRATFRILLDATDGMEVVGEAGDGHQAAALARDCRPDLVLMDIRMPGLDGIEATRMITGERGFADVKVLILTTFETDEHVAEALRAGASGFVGKGIDPQELIDAITTVAAGEALLSPYATRTLIDRFLAQAEPPSALVPAVASLTARERQVVQLVGAGLSNDEIARRLSISVLTAKTHVNRAMTKLHARDRAQVVIAAYESGLVPRAYPRPPAAGPGPAPPPGTV
jgi:DNA-binding NarL/FixJ family response regulator